MTKEYRHRGELIRRCAYAEGEHRGRWIVQTYHDTGIQWSDEECPHYATLAEARAAIDENRRYLADPVSVANEEAAIRSVAQGQWCDYEGLVEIDDDAAVSRGDGGAYVAAWVWVSLDDDEA